MTHEELLAKLWILPADTTELQHGAKAVHALRAVVELHKPVEWLELHKPVEWRKKLYCSFCENIGFDGYPYPCPTIQAIEKELG